MTTSSTRFSTNLKVFVFDKTHLTARKGGQVLDYNLVVLFIWQLAAWEL